MIIAELFVNLGIKGADKTVSALVKVEQGMKDLGSMSLEAKAAIIGAMYALERLFSKSGQAGTDMTNFSKLIGTSTQTLQQYQYAARQVGISNEETEGTFKNLASVMTKLRLGEAYPKGLAQVAMLTGGITGADVEKFMQNPELLLQRLQQYAQKEKRLGIRNEALKSFGLSDNMIAGLSRQAFNPKALSRAPTYSDREIGALDKANIAWSNLGTTISMTIGHFNAAHGGELVKDFTLLTDKVLMLANAFMKLADATHFFEALNKTVEGLALILGIVTDTVNKAQTPKGRQDLKEEAKDTSKFVWNSSGQLTIAVEDFLKGIFAEGKTKATNSVGPKKEEPQSSKSSPHPAAVVQKIFQKDAGIFKPITEDIFGKNPGEKIPESAVIRETNHHTTKQNTILSKERTIGNEKPSLRLVVPVGTAPSLRPSSSVIRENTGKNISQNLNVNQTFNYSGDGKDHRQNADGMKKAVTEAFRQLSSQVQGS